MKSQRTITAIFRIGLMLLCTAGLETPGSAAIAFDFVTVNDLGNPDDNTGHGSVGYEYSIGKYEVTLLQYTAFLNAVAADDTYDLYNLNMETNLNIAGIARSGSPGGYSYSVIGSGNRPVTYVSWFDTARFMNWLHNGQPTGAQNAATTEDGAYSLHGAISGDSLGKNSGSLYWIPTEDEWYKAAYYQPALAGGDTDGYWLYPTRSNDAPGNVIGPAPNQANYYTGVFPVYTYSVTQSPSYSATANYLADGGAYSGSASYYGTFDQGGSVYEWNDANYSGFQRARGGSWKAETNGLPATVDFLTLPVAEFDNLGFRVATIPEPGMAAMLILGASVFVGRRKRT
jgi:sulfatase modifying factor 1